MHSSIVRARTASWLTGAAVIAVAVGAAYGAADEPAHGPRAAGANHTGDGAGHQDDSHSNAGHGEAEHADAHGGADHGGHDFSKVPLPDSIGEMFNSLFFWSLSVFLVYLFVARKYAWAPLIAGLDARESRVNRALHDAEAARVEAEKLLADHAARMEQVQDEVKEIVAAARKEAEAEKARIIAEADAAATALRDEAIADIQAAHRIALDDLQNQIDRQAELATEHVLGVGR